MTEKQEGARQDTLATSTNPHEPAYQSSDDGSEQLFVRLDGEPVIPGVDLERALLKAIDDLEIALEIVRSGFVATEGD